MEHLPALIRSPARCVRRWLKLPHAFLECITGFSKNEVSQEGITEVSAQDLDAMQDCTGTIGTKIKVHMWALLTF